MSALKVTFLTFHFYFSLLFFLYFSSFLYSFSIFFIHSVFYCVFFYFFVFVCSFLFCVFSRSFLSLFFFFFVVRRRNPCWWTHEVTTVQSTFLDSHFTLPLLLFSYAVIVTACQYRTDKCNQAFNITCGSYYSDLERHWSPYLKRNSPVLFGVFLAW